MTIGMTTGLTARLTLGLLSVGALIALSGCYNTQYTYGKVRGQPTTSEWHHRVLFGIVELDGPVNVGDVCPGGDFAKLETKVSLGNGIVTLIARSMTAGSIDLYAPSTIEIWCADGTAYQADVLQDGTVVELRAPEGQAPPELLR